MLKDKELPVAKGRNGRLEYCKPRLHGRAYEPMRFAPCKTNFKKKTDYFVV